VVDPWQGRVLRLDATDPVLPGRARSLKAPPAWNILSATPAHAGATWDLVVWDHSSVTLPLEDTLRVVRLLHGCGSQALFALPQVRWTSLGGELGKRGLRSAAARFCPQPRWCGGDHGDRDYVIRWRGLDAAPQILRIDREWPRADADAR